MYYSSCRGEDGTYYLFYCTDHACGNCLDRPGTAVLVDRFLDPLTLEGTPHLVLWPTMDREISGKGAISPLTDWHTVEGPFYLRHGKWEYLMYSGNSFEQEDYFLGYARCAKQGSLPDKTWEKYPGSLPFGKWAGKLLAAYTLRPGVRNSSPIFHTGVYCSYPGGGWTGRCAGRPATPL